MNFYRIVHYYICSKGELITGYIVIAQKVFVNMKLEILLLVLLVAALDLSNANCRNEERKLNVSNHKVFSSNLHEERQRNREQFFAEFGLKNSPIELGRINNSFPSHSSKEGTLNVCPEGFTFDNTSEPVCYIFTEKQKFPPKCPYPNYLTGRQYYTEELLQRRIIWILAKRNTEDGFGPFEFIEHDYDYGYYVPDYSNQWGVKDLNCMILLDVRTYIPVSCNEKYQALCVYPYASSFIGKYCQKHYGHSNGYTNCIADSFNIENNRCFCERVETNTRYEQHGARSRDLFCNTLAEPLSAFQNHLLINELHPTQDKCWFGLNNEDGKPRWTISDTNVNYTSWARNTNFSKPFGAMQFLNNPGWTLADDDGAISCGICEIQNVYDKNVSIRLKYNPLKNEVELRVKNPFELSDLFGIRYELFCFVGPDSLSFKIPLWTHPDFGNIGPSEDYIEHILFRRKFPTYYWCEGFQHPNYTPVHSNKLLIPNNKGEQEYAIEFMVYTQEKRDPYLENTHQDAYAYVYLLPNLPNINTLRVMKISNFDEDNCYIEMIMHLTTDKAENEREEYEYLEQRFNELLVMDDSPFLKIISFRRGDVCLPSTSLSGNKTLMWPKTYIGALTLSIEICLQENGNPVMRKCESDFWKGGVWSEDSGNCSDDTDLSDRSQKLNDLLNNEDITTNELSKNLSQITENNTDITMVDVYLISEILEKLEASADEVNTTDVVTTISNVMAFEPRELKKAQEILNSTDKMLSSLDKILTKYTVDYMTYDYQMVTSKKVLVQSNDVRKTNITGVALQGNSDDDNFDTYKLIPIYKNTSFETLLIDNIELAAILPETLLLELENCLTNENPIKLIVVLLYSDVLFNENNEINRQTNSKILSILIPNFYCTFSTPIPVPFRPLHNIGLTEKCAHWKYGVDENIGNNIQGRWSEDGIPNANPIQKSHRVCRYDHVTHFSLLMMGSLSRREPSEANTMALNIITAIGSIISLISILAMFLMAIIFRNCRGNCSNKILMNFAVAIALQIMLLYVASNIQKNGIWCIITGASLHYAIVSEFCWMLTIAILQYRKFVIVFQDHIPNFVAKACAFCWCVPFIPIVILLATSIHSYQMNQFGLCYTSGKYFYFGMILPISIIWLINFFVFVRIIFALCHKKVKAYGQKQDESKLQIILALFLFFMLGICWIFGLAVGFGGGIWASYLFCFTATFQGFVLFIFFVVMNGTFRKLWVNLKGAFLCKTQNKKLSKRNVSSTEYSNTKGKTNTSS